MGSLSCLFNPLKTPFVARQRLGKHVPTATMSYILVMIHQNILNFLWINFQTNLLTRV
jgi:hypothetical protein